ncbi:MAG: alpha/beta fold hydrolase [Candidatus Caenarcaniphilales bacterium]|nr:alpha/beta fold hydrolase [Candidatus Caenarcaniphilales bacterium]
MLKNGHIQTILGSLLSWGSGTGLTSIRKVILPDGDVLIVHEDCPKLKPSKIVLLIHGVASSADAPQIQVLSRAFCEAGWVAWRMNQRNCGEGFGISRQIYHAGRSEDLLAVINYIEQKYPGIPLVLIGLSLGGNLLLKLLTEKQISPNLMYSIALNPSVDLERCVTALERPQNWLYHQVFVQRLKRQIAKLGEHSASFPRFDLGSINTLRDFDHQITARMGGFRSGADYYALSSTHKRWSEIKNSVLVMTAADDPFVPAQIFKDLPFNPYTRIEVVEYGGHLGYLHHEGGKLKTWMPEYCVYVAEEQLRIKLEKQSQPADEQSISNSNHEELSQIVL